MSARAPVVAYFVSGHGYGHATRAALVLERLAAALPVRAHVRTSAAARLFAGTGATLSTGVEEPPLLQRGGLDVDWEGSLRVQREALERRDAAVAAEAAWLAALRPDLVLSDAPSLACEAAAKAGVPCRLISNFTWDWCTANAPRPPDLCSPTPEMSWPTAPPRAAMSRSMRSRGRVSSTQGS